MLSKNPGPSATPGKKFQSVSAHSAHLFSRYRSTAFFLTIRFANCWARSGLVELIQVRQKFAFLPHMYAQVDRDSVEGQLNAREL